MIPPVRGCGSAPDGCCGGGRVSPHGRLEVLGGHPGLDQHDPAAVVHGVHHAAEPPADALRPRRREEDPRRKLPLTPYPPLSFASPRAYCTGTSSTSTPSSPSWCSIASPGWTPRPPPCVSPPEPARSPTTSPTR